MSLLECMEKAAEMRQKKANAMKMAAECPKKCPESAPRMQCLSCQSADESAASYDSLASKYDTKAMRRQGYGN